MAATSLTVRCWETTLPATMTWPAKDCRAAVALLHPANDPSRNQFLFDQLAQVLPELGIAVLRYDRRRFPANRDVPYQLQLDDLGHALAVLAAEVGPVPTGLWGFSQGAWVALLAAAADPELAFLVVVGCSAVSPARQMRYGTGEQLRRAGFGADALTELAHLRLTYEDYERGRLTQDEAQAVIEALAGRPWFHLSWVPPKLPESPGWDDMDFDPSSAIRQLRCPVLAFYGDDEWIPVAESIGIWRSCIRDRDQLTICQLAGTTHHPTLREGRDVASISPEYTAILTSWLNDVVTSRNR